MKTRVILVIVLGMLALLAVLIGLYTPGSLSPEPGSPDSNVVSTSALPEAAPKPVSAELPLTRRMNSGKESRSTVSRGTTDESALAVDKLQRLAQTRETFRALAAGDPLTALRAAAKLTDETEHETALLTLVTEWTRGELSSPRQRAGWIAAFGLEAGLGMELVKNPELALLWANELTDGRGRSALLQRIAVEMTESDPAGALALSAQVPENERRRFSDSVYAGWAANDTAAALQWADQAADPAEREAALQAIRQVAPVGIGAELRTQDGYQVINRLLPGTPAELSGQLHPGDRIVALAQGDSSFVDARSLSLQQVVQLIRGAPGTALQLQILPANAPANSVPQTISITREQIKFKK